MTNNFSSGNTYRIAQFASALLLLAFLPACATPKGASSKNSFQVLEATQQTTLPGRSETAPTTVYRFRIVWKSKTAPRSFFWRPDEKSWMHTNVAKPIQRSGFAPDDFTLIDRNVNPGTMRYGDTVILTTYPVFEKESVPSAVRKMPVRSLYYQTSANSKWTYSTVAVRKLPDIVMP